MQVSGRVEKPKSALKKPREPPGGPTPPEPAAADGYVDLGVDEDGVPLPRAKPPPSIFGARPASRGASSAKGARPGSAGAPASRASMSRGEAKAALRASPYQADPRGGGSEVL